MTIETNIIARDIQSPSRRDYMNNPNDAYKDVRHYRRESNIDHEDKISPLGHEKYPEKKAFSDFLSNESKPAITSFVTHNSSSAKNLKSEAGLESEDIILPLIDVTLPLKNMNMPLINIPLPLKGAALPLKGINEKTPVSSKNELPATPQTSITNPQASIENNLTPPPKIAMAAPAVQLKTDENQHKGGVNTAPNSNIQTTENNTFIQNLDHKPKNNEATFVPKIKPDFQSPNPEASISVTKAPLSTVKNNVLQPQTIVHAKSNILVQNITPEHTKSELATKPELFEGSLLQETMVKNLAKPITPNNNVEKSPFEAAISSNNGKAKNHLPLETVNQNPIKESLQNSSSKIPNIQQNILQAIVTEEPHHTPIKELQNVEVLNAQKKINNETTLNFGMMRKENINAAMHEQKKNIPVKGNKKLANNTLQKTAAQSPKNPMFQSTYIAQPSSTMVPLPSHQTAMVQNSLQPTNTAIGENASFNAQVLNSLSSKIDTASQAAHIPPKMVTEQISAAMNKIAAKGKVGEMRQFTLRLKPAELGQVDVKMEFLSNGKVQTIIIVDNKETLAMLQKDQGALEKTLSNAGFDTSNSDLSFSLKQQDRNAGKNFASGTESHQGNGESISDNAQEEALTQPLNHNIRARVSSSTLDINV